jgi:hypothetical protein
VDADADLDLVLGQVERRLPGRGDGARGEAMPMLRPAALTRRATSATSASERRSSAAAPAIFSSSTVTPTPRRPAV